MGNRGLIGHTGFVGEILKPQFEFNKYYGRNTVSQMYGENFELLVCAAPTGNRIQVNQDCVIDLETTMFLIDHLRKANIGYFVLISTVDVLQAPNTKYGLNRRLLEGWVKTNLTNYTIVRLPTLIHPTLRKNILFDLKNKTFLDKLNPESSLQYYDMSNIKKDIEYAIANGVRELNLVSEPIRNSEVIDTFLPSFVSSSNPSPAQNYDIKPYSYTKEEMLTAMRKYFNA